MIVFRKRGKFHILQSPLDSAVLLLQWTVELIFLKVEPTRGILDLLYDGTLPIVLTNPKARPGRSKFENSFDLRICLLGIRTWQIAEYTLNEGDNKIPSCAVKFCPYFIYIFGVWTSVLWRHLIVVSIDFYDRVIGRFVWRTLRMIIGPFRFQRPLARRGNYMCHTNLAM